MDLPELTNLNEEAIAGKRVIVRTAFNVPIEEGEIQDDFRIRKALPTITLLKSYGARIILISHLSGERSKTLKPVHEYLSKSLDVAFLEEIESSEAESHLNSMKDGDVVLIENIRKFKGEVEGERSFAEKLASMGDLFVNDDFPVSHRNHASVVELPKLLPSVAGIQFMEEYKSLSKAGEPEHPFLLIVGGAKFETKVPLIRSFVGRADTLYIAGALANLFYEHKGYEVGDSLLPKTSMDIDDLMEEESIELPRDVMCQTVGGVESKAPNAVELTDEIVDIGPESLEDLSQLIDEALFVIWNGPLGYYERGFEDTTLDLAQMIADSAAESIVGGGDTLAAIQELELEDSFDFVSTAGGAMVEFLSKGTLPGIEALRR